MITQFKCKVRNNSDTTLKQIYQYYIDNRLDVVDITSSMFNDILNEFHDNITNLIIYKNYEWHMPYLGSLSIRKSKPRGRKIIVGNNVIINYPVDYKKTKELWEKNESAKNQKRVVFHLNENTSRYVMKWKWDRNIEIKNITAYQLRIVRRLKRKITKALQLTNYKIDFFELKK